MEISLSPDEARRVVLAAGCGAGLLQPYAGAGAEGGLEAISAIGFVQIDTISVLRRAHDHVLWSRAPGWRPEDMAVLEASPRRVIEYWAHAAAWLPLADWRYCLPRMRRIEAAGRHWHDCDHEVAQSVLARIRDEGPLMTRHTSGPTDKAGPWWDWKPAKVALEYLFHSGRLVAATRRGFQKVYDLPERHLPPELLAMASPDEREMAGWLIDRAGVGLGIFSEADAVYQRREGRTLLGAEIVERLVGRTLARVRIAGEVTGPALFARPEAIQQALSSPVRDRVCMRFLSPFDPLIIQRRRALRFFGLDYTIECYTPAPKRRFGYFALPILVADGSDIRFAGLIDAAMDRASKTLVIRRARIDAPAGDPDVFLAALSTELAAFAAFNGATKTLAEQVESGDGRFARRLRSRLNVKRLDTKARLPTAWGKADQSADS